MNVKIQGGGKNSGVYENTGSCVRLVEYLEHEDKERCRDGLDVIPFFNGQGLDVERGEVIQKLDRNHKKLHYSDAKFYHLDINPSQDELRAMGEKDEEIIANCKIFAVKLTDLYARNFKKDIVEKDENGNEKKRPLSGKDIMIFWKVHVTRGDKDGLQIHIHGIPSRKDIHNRYQLSPITKHRGTEKGPVTGGFERTTFYREVEKLFDETFEYDRKEEETFDYCNARKKERKAAEKVDAMIEEAGKEKGIAPVPDTKIKDALVKRDQRRRNEFWNEYHSKYKPLYDKLKAASYKSYIMYKDAKEKDGICSRAINERFKQLKSVYAEMNARHNDVESAKSAKGLLNAVSSLVFLMNPVAGIVMGLVGNIVAEAYLAPKNEAQKRLRLQAASIRDSIDELKRQQSELRQDTTDRLKVYVEDKQAKDNLQREINYLKATLSEPKLRYIVHSRTDASVYNDDKYDWGHLESEKIRETMRQRLVDEGYFVGWGMNTYESDLKLKKESGNTYRTGYLDLKDGKAVLHEEKIFGRPELTAPAFKIKSEPEPKEKKKINLSL